MQFTWVILFRLENTEIFVHFLHIYGNFGANAYLHFVNGLRDLCPKVIDNGVQFV